MIPKIIHYCWFGKNPIPEQYKKYIKSWYNHMPDFDIKEWNESNYDVNCIPFSEEAYRVGKYAYVSDYARLKILYENGGIYLDTDVEMIRPLYNIISDGGYMGFEKNTNVKEGELLNVALGLGFAVEPNNSIIREIMEYYENHHFINSEGYIEQITIVKITSDILKRRGLKYSDRPIKIGKITIYPWDYFCPLEFLSNKIEITENTYTIHHYSATWMSWYDKIMMKKGNLGKKIRRFFNKLLKL